jgi:hypothetical protein
VTVRRLSVLQWTGLFVGAAVWFAVFVAGYGVTEARCGAAGFSPVNDRWQAGLLVLGAAGILGAEAAALTVLRRTSDVSYEADPPLARIRFFAIAAVVANLLFLAILVLSSIGSIAGEVCRQS